jgi:hypothetical protein
VKSFAEAMMCDENVLQCFGKYGAVWSTDAGAMASFVARSKPHGTGVLDTHV